VRGQKGEQTFRGSGRNGSHSSGGVTDLSPDFKATILLKVVVVVVVVVFSSQSQGAGGFVFSGTTFDLADRANGD